MFSPTNIMFQITGPHNEKNPHLKANFIGRKDYQEPSQH